MTDAFAELMVESGKGIMGIFLLISLVAFSQWLMSAYARWAARHALAGRQGPSWWSLLWLLAIVLLGAVVPMALLLAIFAGGHK
jgi:hypothetical protein